MEWDGSEFPGGTHRGHPSSGQGRCSTSPPWAGASAESPQHSSGAWKLLWALPAGPGFRSCSGSQEPELQQQRALPVRGTGSEGKGWFAPVNPTTLTLPGLPAYPHLNCTQLLGQLHWGYTHRPPKENQALGAENATEQGQEKNRFIP